MIVLIDIKRLLSLGFPSTARNLPELDDRGKTARGWMRDDSRTTANKIALEYPS